WGRLRPTSVRTCPDFPDGAFPPWPPGRVPVPGAPSPLPWLAAGPPGRGAGDWPGTARTSRLGPVAPTFPWGPPRGAFPPPHTPPVAFRAAFGRRGAGEGGRGRGGRGGPVNGLFASG